MYESGHKEKLSAGTRVHPLRSWYSPTHSNQCGSCTVIVSRGHCLVAPLAPSSTVREACLGFSEKQLDHVHLSLLSEGVREGWGSEGEREGRRREGERGGAGGWKEVEILSQCFAAGKRRLRKTLMAVCVCDTSTTFSEPVIDFKVLFVFNWQLITLSFYKSMKKEECFRYKTIINTEKHI